MSFNKDGSFKALAQELLQFYPNKIPDGVAVLWDFYFSSFSPVIGFSQTNFLMALAKQTFHRNVDLCYITDSSRF